MHNLTLTLKQWEILARTVIGAGGGYLLSAGFAVSLAELLPMPRADAGLLATMLAFLVFACAVVWAFAGRTLRAVAIGVLVPALVFGVSAHFLQGAGS